MGYDSDVADFRQKAENDTNFFCRHVLKMTESKHWPSGEMRPGGVRRDGPHAVMTAFLDDGDVNRKMLQAPRGSYKTSIAHGYLMRRTLKNPNLRVLYGMETYGEAIEKMGFIREHFATNSLIHEVWGKQQTKQWSQSKFTITGRTIIRPEPTFSAFGVDKNVTGKHYDIIFADDLVTKDNVRSKDGIEKVLRCWDGLLFLLDPGGLLCDIGTRHNDEDLHGHIEKNLGDAFDICKLSCGLEWEPDDAGRPQLVGDSVFEHLSKGFLLQQFEELHSSMAQFSSQYMNKCLSDAMLVFRRNEFLTERWATFMQDLSVYLLVDTATGAGEENCYSCGLLVGLDSRGDAYVMDAFCGLLDPMTTTTEILTMVERWESKNPVRKIVMENATANQVFQPMIEQAARQMRLRVHIEKVRRGQSATSKRQHILGLQGWFQQRRIHFVDTLPRNYHEAGKMKTFFDPEGFGDGTNILPDGELVRHFVRYGSYGRDDLADALALLNALDDKGNRVCAYGSRRREDKRKDLRRKRGMTVPIPMRVNGRMEMVDVLTSGTHDSKPNSWISQYGRKR